MLQQLRAPDHHAAAGAAADRESSRRRPFGAFRQLAVARRPVPFFHTGTERLSRDAAVEPAHSLQGFDQSDRLSEVIWKLEMHAL